MKRSLFLKAKEVFRSKGNVSSTLRIADGKGLPGEIIEYSYDLQAGSYTQDLKNSVKYKRRLK